MGLLLILKSAAHFFSLDLPDSARFSSILYFPRRDEFPLRLPLPLCLTTWPSTKPSHRRPSWRGPLVLPLTCRNLTGASLFHPQAPQNAVMLLQPQTPSSAEWRLPCRALHFYLTTGSVLSSTPSNPRHSVPLRSLPSAARSEALPSTKPPP